MLVLSRQKGEKIVINDDLVITIVDVRGDRVRLGIEGDKQKYPVVRQELWVPVESVPPDDSSSPSPTE